LRVCSVATNKPWFSTTGTNGNCWLLLFSQRTKVTSLDLLVEECQLVSFVLNKRVQVLENIRRNVHVVAMLSLKLYDLNKTHEPCLITWGLRSLPFFRTSSTQIHTCPVKVSSRTSHAAVVLVGVPISLQLSNRSRIIKKKQLTSSTENGHFSRR
jgi:hypothetical protein